MYSGYETPFDGAGSWHFDNDFARNIGSFGADNSLSSHADNCKNNSLLLSEAILTEALDHQRKMLVLILVNQAQNVPWVGIIMVITVC